VAKAKIPLTRSPARGAPHSRRDVSKSTNESSLLMVRLKELDREFARQTRQLTALTKKFGKKLTGINPD